MIASCLIGWSEHCPACAGWQGGFGCCGSAPWRDRFSRGRPSRPSALLQGRVAGLVGAHSGAMARSEEHTSELQSLMRISYAVFCLKKNIRERSDLDLTTQATEY